MTLPTFTEVTVPGQKPVVTSLMKDFTAEALEQLRFWLEINPPAIPITQIVGFVGYTVQAAPTVGTQQALTPAVSAYGDLATLGPQLTGIPPGQYLFLYGAAAWNSGGNVESALAISINGAAPADATDAAISQTTVPVAVAIAAIKSLSAASNTVTVKYRGLTGSGSANFARRWLIAIKFANA
jgi:hypothetical protein